jgi:acyl-coenzyme A synthetase/AMP-(fatty) acid ligase
MNNWFDFILFHAQTQPEKPAMVMEDRVVTYRMLKIGIERCANHIVALNIRPENPVAILVRNPIRHFTLSLALYRIGIGSISLEHSQVGIADLKVAAVLGDSDAASLVHPENRFVEVTDAWFSQDALQRLALPNGFFQQTQVCRYSLTSGTTGAPKIIQHRVEDVGRRVLKFVDLNWRLVLSLPGLSSNFGFTNGCAALTSGRSLCFADSPFQAIRMIELFSVDLVAASTEQLLALTRVARKLGAHVRSLRAIYVAGSSPSRALLEASMLNLCNDIHCKYSTSEVGQVAFASGRDVLSKPGLVGHIVPGVEVGIFDQHGSQCSIGQTGVVKCRRKDSTGRLDTEENSWIDLGDLGWVAEDGQLHIIGRLTDTGTGTTQVAANQMLPIYEIEHLLRLEWDTEDAAAIQVNVGPEAQIWVGIVGNEDITAEKVAAIARRQGIEHAIKLFNLPAIPRTSSGKINRAQLKMLIQGRRELAAQAIEEAN